LKKNFNALLTVLIIVLFMVCGSGCVYILPQPNYAPVPVPIPAPLSNPNQLPVISNITSQDQQIWQGEKTTIRVCAYDSDGDPLQFSWSSTGGTLLVDDVRNPTFVAPEYLEIDTDFWVTLTVNDGKDGRAQASIVIRVQHRDRECCTNITISSPNSFTYVCQGSPITVFGRVWREYCDGGCGINQGWNQAVVEIRFDGSHAAWAIIDQGGFYQATFRPPCNDTRFLYPNGGHQIEAKTQIDCCRKATARTFIAIGTCCRSCGH
jgi:hypothetical protein